MGKKTKVVRTTNHSEEDIQNKIILPLLREIGFEEDQLIFQHRFTIQIGHNELEVESVGGRSDILCKSFDGKKTLFVIEAKRDDIEFSDEEIEQVISYARLVHPIAPFSILANGKDFKIYNTYTKELCRKNRKYPNLVKRSKQPGLEEDSKYIYEALNYLVGYNIINLEIFVKEQQSKRMSTLLGGIDNLDRNYIPKLYQAPPDLDPTFRKFLSDTKSVFLLTGEQGVGKTSAMCYLAQQARDNHIALFYAGHIVSGDINELIRDDCNWFFSRHLSDIEAAKRLASLASSSRKLIIFIDAVDEFTIPDFPKMLNKLVVDFKYLPNTKIVISSKIYTAGRFLKIGGTASDLANQLFNPDTNNRKNFSYKVELFDTGSFKNIYAHYCSQLSIKGNPPVTILEELHRGIALKVFSLVFQGGEVDLKIGFRELFKQYLSTILSKISKPEKALNILLELCKFIFEKNRAENRENYSLEYIVEQEFQEYLKFGPSDEIPTELFDYNILIRQSNQNNTLSVGFYYTMVRDYLMVTATLDLSSMDFIKFEAKINELSQFGLGKDLIYVINLFSDLNRKDWLKRIYENKCEQFSNEMVRIINLIHPDLRIHLFNGFSNNIGFVFGNFLKPNILGIRERFKNEPLVEYFSGPIEFQFLTDPYNLFALSFAGPSILSGDPIDLAHKEITERITKVVNTRKLDISLFKIRDIHNSICDRVSSSSPKAVIEEYLRTFFKDFLDCYGVIIESNFGSLSGSFELFREQPIDLYFSVDLNTNSLTYRLIKNGSNFVIYEEEIKPRDKVFLHMTIHLGACFSRRDSFTHQYMNQDKESYLAVIRNFVFRRIEKELRNPNFKLKITTPSG